MLDDVVLKVIGKLIAYGGGCVAISYTFFKFLGKNWIENQFKKELEEHRAKINSLLARISKIQDKEFEVLPEAWCKLVKAIGAIEHVVGLRRLANIDDLNSEKLEEYLKETDLRESDKNRIRKSSNKTKLFGEIQVMKDLNSAEKARVEFHNYIILNKIILPTELFELFSKLDSLLIHTSVNYELGQDYNGVQQTIEAYNTLSEKIKPELPNVEKLIQKRLHYFDVQ